jgi:hypothetical protein
VALKRAVGICWNSNGEVELTTEAVQGASLPLQGVHHIHGCHSLPLGVLTVGNCVTDDVLQEELEYTTDLLVDEAGDTLDTATASQPADGRFGNALDVISQHFAMALSATFAKSFASLSATTHVELLSSMKKISNKILNIAKRMALYAS